MDVLTKDTQVFTHAIAGLVKLGVGGFNITIGDIVEVVVPQELETDNVAVINGVGQIEAE